MMVLMTICCTDCGNGEIDVLIGALREPAPIEDIEQIRCSTIRLSVVARVGHPLFASPKRSARTISWLTLGRVAARRADAGLFRTDVFAGSAREPAGPDRDELAGHDARLLLRGDRLTLISTNQIVMEQELGLLAPLPVKTPGSARRIGLTVRRGWRPTATHEGVAGAHQGRRARRPEASFPPAWARQIRHHPMILPP